MKGTEKQVLWVNEIKKNFMSMAETYVEDQKRRVAEGDFSQSLLDACNIAMKKFELWFEKMDCSFIIEHRDRLSSTFLREKIAEEYKKLSV